MSITQNGPATPTGRADDVRPASASLVRVPFREGFLLAAHLDDGVFVPIRPVCEALGISPQGQLARLRSKPWACIKMILSQMPGDDQARQVAFVDLRSLPMWLATIEPSRVRPEARGALLAYQQEAAAVLAAHFLGAPLDAPAVARLAAEASALRAEVRQLARGRRRLSDHDAARVRVYCHGRDEVTPGEVLASALELDSPEDVEVKATARLLRTLGYTAPRKAGPALSDERVLFTRRQALPARCA